MVLNSTVKEENMKFTEIRSQERKPQYQVIMKLMMIYAL